MSTLPVAVDDDIADLRQGSFVRECSITSMDSGGRGWSSSGVGIRTNGHEVTCISNNSDEAPLGDAGGQ